VAQTREQEIQIAVAVQVGHAGGVVIWSASIDAFSKVDRVQTPGYRDQREQE
jgi:hypothetical protein